MCTHLWWSDGQMPWPRLFVGCGQREYWRSGQVCRSIVCALRLGGQRPGHSARLLPTPPTPLLSRAAQLGHFPESCLLAVSHGLHCVSMDRLNLSLPHLLEPLHCPLLHFAWCGSRFGAPVVSDSLHVMDSLASWCKRCVYFMLSS